MSTLAAALIAKNPGPAAHMALLGGVVLIGLIVFAIVRVRNKRDQAEARNAEKSAAEISASGHQRPSGSHDRHSGPRHH